MKQQLFSSGILFLETDETTSVFAKTVTLEKTEYTHLIDGIYLPCPMHELNLEQLQDVNRLRDHDFKKNNLEQKNDRLKKMVVSAIEAYAKNKALTVVDVGCGKTTIAPYFNKLTRYIGIDIDPEVVQHLKEQGIESALIKDISSTRLDRDGIAAFISLYVLHFNIDNQFFKDIAKVMRQDDVMFTNLYRVSDERKAWLKEQAENAGLSLAPEVPDTEISPGRQVFWVLSKKRGAANKVAKTFQKSLSPL